LVFDGEVLEDGRRLGEPEVAILQHGHLAVRVDALGERRLVVLAREQVDDLEVDLQARFSRQTA
jgi:hypothetical protein